MWDVREKGSVGQGEGRRTTNGRANTALVLQRVGAEENTKAEAEQVT